MTRIVAIRSHEIACGHRVYGHESKCRHLHGHNYVIVFHVEHRDGHGELDSLGRVLDFGVIKSLLCAWLERSWDHRLLIWHDDPMLCALRAIDPSVVAVPFNPTAENMAAHLLNVVAPQELAGTDATCVAVHVHETGKCSVSASRT